MQRTSNGGDSPMGLRVGSRIAFTSRTEGTQNDGAEGNGAGPIITKHWGTIQYIGPARFDNGKMEVWVGVELDEKWPDAASIGVVGERADGMVGGMRFFQCTPGCAVFVKRADLLELYNRFSFGNTENNESSNGIINTNQQEKSIDEQNEAAIKIQCLVRKTIAKKKVRGMFASHTWNVLDTHLEELGLLRNAAVARAQHNLQKEQEKIRQEAGSEQDVVERVIRLAEREVAELTMESLAAIRVSKDYDGPHLRFPLHIDAVKAMMEDFKQDKILHYKYLMALFLKAKQIFAVEPNVQEIFLDGGDDESEKTYLTVVGDTHGQLDDLFTIFSIKGLPSPRNLYLFNGDFVDRGARGVEILAVLCAFKILYPSAVFLNRGNHEARAQNAWMGFEEEILAKYSQPSVIIPNDRRAALRIHILCEQMFDNLPLCAVLQNKVFICHGGLFRNDGVTLNHLRSISRKREPPLNGRSFEDRVFEDILWSDPRPTPHYPRPLTGRRTSDRGAGCEFGYAITQQFCALNSIALVVRSHECVPEGYEILHNGRLITIFSASRYCGTQTNKGAFMTFGPDLQPEVQQFYAETEAAAFITEEERQRALEEDAIHMIIEQIVDKKLDLYWYFTRNDVQHTGYVSRLEWATALINVLGLNLPYLHYQKYLADVEEEGPFANQINYSKFLSRFQIRGRDEDSAWQDAIIARVCERLYYLCTLNNEDNEVFNVEKAWRKFDSNTDGRIEFSEFVETLKSLDVGLTDQQIYELMRSVDSDADAHIDFKEFTSRFGPAFDLITASKVQEPDASPKTKRKQSMRRVSWIDMDDVALGTLRQLSRVMYRVEGAGGLPAAFAHFDKDNKGYFGCEEFVEVVKSRYGIELPDNKIEEVYKKINTNGVAHVTYFDFLNAFQITDTRAALGGGDDWRSGVIQQVANVLYQLRVHARAAFRNFFDVDNEGRISAAEFRKGMVAFNESMDSPLTLMQIEELTRALDKNGDGYILYRDFFDSLSIVDDKSDQSGDGKVNALVRKSSSFYFQRLERDERLGKLVASKMAAAGRPYSSSMASSRSSSDDDLEEVSGIADDEDIQLS